MKLSLAQNNPEYHRGTSLGDSLCLEESSVQLDSRVSFQETVLQMGFQGSACGASNQVLDKKHLYGNRRESSLQPWFLFWRQAVKMSKCLSPIFFRWSEDRSSHRCSWSAVWTSQQVILLQQAWRLFTEHLLWGFLWSLLEQYESSLRKPFVSLQFRRFSN